MESLLAPIERTLTGGPAVRRAAKILYFNVKLNLIRWPVVVKNILWAHQSEIEGPRFPASSSTAITESGEMKAVRHGRSFTDFRLWTGTDEFPIASLRKQIICV
jgi:hypothetical protein